MARSITKSRIARAMQHLRHKASRIREGDLVHLDAERNDDHAPGPGLYGLTKIGRTFIKVTGYGHWVPVERVQGILYRVPAPDLQVQPAT